MRLHSIYIFALNLFLTDCKPPCSKDSDLNRNVVDKKIQEYFVYKKDSYWVYQNKNKTMHDSLSVVFYQEDWGVLDRTHCRKNQKFLMTLKSIDKHLFQSDSINTIAEQDRFITNLNSTIKPSHPFILNGIRGFYNLGNDVISLSRSSEKSKYFIEAIITNTVMLNNQVYEGDVQYFQDTISKTKLYIQKDIGIIGWTNPEDTFNLTNFHVKK